LIQCHYILQILLGLENSELISLLFS